MRRRRRIFTIFAFIFGIAVALCISEMILQSFNAKQHKSSWFALDKIMYDPELFWKFRPGFKGPSVQSGDISINSDGFRARPLISRPDLLIFCLGDSCTFGIGIPAEENTYPAILERMLSQAMSPKTVRVINAGCPGYSSLQGLRLASRIVDRFKPDVVTIFFGWNDRWLDLVADHDKDSVAYQEYAQIRYGDDRIRLFNLLRSAKYDIISALRGENYFKIKYIVRRVSAEEYRQNLTKTAEYCTKHNVRPILCAIPSALRFGRKPIPVLLKLSGAKSKDELDSSIEELNHILRSIAVTGIAALVDIPKEVEKSDHLETLFTNPSQDPIHPGIKGHQSIAKLLAEKILSDGKINQQNNQDE